MAEQIGHGGDVAYDIGGVVASGVDEAKPFYGIIVTTGGTCVLKGVSTTTADIGSPAAGTIIAGLHLIGYTGTAVIQKLI